MSLVLLTALGVGGATVAGAVMGFLFQEPARRHGSAILCFAAGVMLAAAVLGLILPALDFGGLWTTVLGICTGALCIRLLDRYIPHLHAFPGDRERTALFVWAIAIHNFPEGLAAGVSFGTDSTADAMAIAFSIAAQNLPEGMILIAPMRSAGVPPGKTLLCAAATGLVEVLGTFLGYFAVVAAREILPFSLAFAGGTMLYVIVEDMLPHKNAAPPLLAGFCLMLIVDHLIQ